MEFVVVLLVIMTWSLFVDLVLLVYFYLLTFLSVFIGFACSGGLVQPVTCPRGQYCPSNSGLYALDCPPGKYGNNTGFFSLSQCSNCEAGFYSLFAGSTASSSCVSSLGLLFLVLFVIF